MAHTGFRTDSFKMSDRIFNMFQQIISCKNKNKILAKRYEERCVHIYVRGRQRMTTIIFYIALCYCHLSGKSKPNLKSHLKLFPHSFFLYSFTSTLLTHTVNPTL